MAEANSPQQQVAAVGDAVVAEATALATYCGSLDQAGWEGPSWCEGWSVHEVVSHLVEGSERFAMQTRAALSGEPVPEFTVEERTARRQEVKKMQLGTLVDELVRRNTGFFDYLRTLPAADLTRPDVPLPAGRMSGVQVALLRLSETALHHWDCLAPTNPEAALKAATAGLMADSVLPAAGRLAKKDALAGVSTVYRCETSGPGGGPVTITCRDGAAQIARGGDTPADVKLRLPTEMLLRLVWGRVTVERELDDGVIRVDGDKDAVRTLGRIFGNR
jgi:uncharacterized protein (TIGR03083 family)